MTEDIFSPTAAVSLTQTLVQIPSENPNGDEIVVGQFVASWLEQHDIETSILPVEGERANILGRLRGAGGPPLVLLAHLDTVPIGDRQKWQHDPFGAEVEGDWLYGRGSADMKSGLAVAMIVMARLKQLGLPLSGDLVLAGTVDEEAAFMKGAHALSSIIPANAYLAALEPTGCQLNIAHKGCYWFEVTMRGRAAHAANPTIGADANRAMAEAMLGWYSGMEEIRQQPNAFHPLLGAPTLVVSKLQGGFMTNIVSELCHCEMDVRIPPPFQSEQINQLIETVARQAAALYGVEVDIQYSAADQPPVECPPDSPLVTAFAAAYQNITGQVAEPQGFLGYTDAAILATRTANPHAIVFGPGLLSDAHTTDERVAISQIIEATAVVEEAVRQLLGQDNK